MKYILSFRIKYESAFPFPVVRLEKYDQDEWKAFVTLIEEETPEKAWYTIFRLCPEYRESRIKLLSDYLDSDFLNWKRKTGFSGNDPPLEYICSHY